MFFGIIFLTRGRRRREEGGGGGGKRRRWVGKMESEEQMEKTEKMGSGVIVT